MAGLDFSVSSAPTRKVLLTNFAYCGCARPISPCPRWPTGRDRTRTATGSKISNQWRDRTCSVQEISSFPADPPSPSHSSVYHQSHHTLHSVTPTDDSPTSPAYNSRLCILWLWLERQAGQWYIKSLVLVSKANVMLVPSKAYSYNDSMIDMVGMACNSLDVLS